VGLSARLGSKRGVSAAVAVPALVLLLATSRTWLSGRSAEPLLGGGVVSATGSQVAPGVVALALVCLVALLTTLTGGRVVRRVSSVVLVIAAAGSVALTLPPLSDPEQALGRVAAAGLGRTGVVRTTAAVSAWAWTALAAGALLAVAAVLTIVAARRWSGLSSRFDVPTDAGDSSAPPSEPGEPVTTGAAEPGRDVTAQGTNRTTWDELSEGRDPTVHPVVPHTPSSVGERPDDPAGASPGPG
jgi:uncharacterized membrane protein (TIGR02234 family)